MYFLDLTLDSPAANVALDEALLEHAEAGHNRAEIFRLWQPTRPMVVVGRSSEVEREVNLQHCSDQLIPVIRRCSGGATILTDAGCLMYAVLLDYRRRPELRHLDLAHQFVMEKIQRAIALLGIETQFQGTCDLTLNNRKVSGNALRCKKNWMIYHGTLICESMQLRQISLCLGQPKRQPEYRDGRSHDQFLSALPVGTESLKQSLLEIWKCDGLYEDWPRELTQQLVHAKYSTDAWNRRI